MVGRSHGGWFSTGCGSQEGRGGAGGGAGDGGPEGAADPGEVLTAGQIR